MAGKHSISKMVCGRLRTAHITPDNLVQEADLKLRDKAEEYIKANKVGFRKCEIKMALKKYDRHHIIFAMIVFSCKNVYTCPWVCMYKHMYASSVSST